MWLCVADVPRNRIKAFNSFIKIEWLWYSSAYWLGKINVWIALAYFWKLQRCAWYCLSQIYCIVETRSPSSTCARNKLLRISHLWAECRWPWRLPWAVHFPRTRWRRRRRLCRWRRKFWRSGFEARSATRIRRSGPILGCRIKDTIYYWQVLSTDAAGPGSIPAAPKCFFSSRV